MSSFITRESDYAIRITAFLAGMKSKTQAAVSEISERLHISRSYAARIIHELKKGGIVKTTQGLYGGVSLAREASEISFYDVLQAMKFKTSLNDCLESKDACLFPSVCKVHGFLGGLERKLFEELKKNRISDYAFDESLIDSVNSAKL
ncbi:MAG: RrF2 family transcriptional regulator [Syntrophothermus sp.]